MNTSESEKITFVAPLRFWEDHVQRSDEMDVLRQAEVVCGSKGMTVLLTQEQMDELLSDAEFYAEGGVQEFGFDLAGVVSSARATVRRIAKMGATS